MAAGESGHPRVFAGAEGADADADAADAGDDGADDADADADADAGGDDVVRRELPEVPRDGAACVARLRIEALDNREAWPVAFVLAAAVVERLGGDLREAPSDELFELQRTVPRVAGHGPERSPAGSAAASADEVASADAPADDELLN